MAARNEILITPTELEALLQHGEPVTILDVRWRLDQPDGRGAYEQGHIPGAVYVSLDEELSDHAVPGRGRHPLPSGSALQEHVRRWGVRQDTQVVVYDDWNRAGSARAWWVLTAAGLPDVRILDGGLAAWTAAEGTVETGTSTTEPSDVVLDHRDLYAGGRPTLTAQQVAERGSDTILLDARAPERFRGDVEPVDPVAGHIPGARNAPSTSVLTEGGAFLPERELHELFAASGADATADVGVYCGSGVTAAVTLAALAAAGVDAALFPGSWSQWSSDPANPVAVGADELSNRG
jgi:thiosulfate/3-mercaptopyruvate sulfurtransferase